MSHAVYRVKGSIHPDHKETYFLTYTQWHEVMQVILGLFAQILRYWPLRITISTTLYQKKKQSSMKNVDSMF